MNNIRKYLGLVWMLLAPAILGAMFWAAFHFIEKGGTSDISQPLPWIIIISIFTPICIGFALFGWYAWKGEYENLEILEEEQH